MDDDLKRLAQLLSHPEPNQEDLILVGVSLLGGFLTDIRRIADAQERLASTVIPGRLGGS
jgi:hypothetical protein